MYLFHIWNQFAVLNDSNYNREGTDVLLHAIKFILKCKWLRVNLGITISLTITMFTIRHSIWKTVAYSSEVPTKTRIISSNLIGRQKLVFSSVVIMMIITLLCQWMTSIYSFFNEWILLVTVVRSCGFVDGDMNATGTQNSLIKFNTLNNCFNQHSFSMGSFSDAVFHFFSKISGSIFVLFHYISLFNRHYSLFVPLIGQ